MSEESISYYKSPESARYEAPLGQTQLKNIKRAYAASLSSIADNHQANFMNPFIIEKASGKYSMLSAESGELTREGIEKIGEKEREGVGIPYIRMIDHTQ